MSLLPESWSIMQEHVMSIKPVNSLATTYWTPLQGCHKPWVGNNVDQASAGLSTLKQNVNSRLAPTINVKLYDSCHTNALPDFGADISAAGEPFLCLLNDHIHNFLPSEVIQQTANGWKMYPLGYLPVTFTTGFRQCTDKNHSYPNIPGTILLYKVAKALAILSEHYLQLILLHQS